MSNVDVTAYIAGIGGLLTAIALAYGTVKTARKATTDTNVDTWHGLAEEYKADRNAARGELATIDASYRSRIAALQADYEARIATLEAENAGLRQRPPDRGGAP